MRTKHLPACRHEAHETVNLFCCGPATTTPPLAEVNTNWPNPWIFARLIIVCALLYLGFDWAYGNYGNSNLVPGLIFVGNFGIPISIAILFFELNVRRDIPIVGWLDDIGVLAIAVSLITAAVYRRTAQPPSKLQTLSWSSSLYPLTHKRTK